MNWSGSMKNKLLLSNLREIKSSFKRFISLVIISLLGVGFFVGIKVSSVDMLESLDSYLDDAKIYDIKISSPIGFSTNAIDRINELDVFEETLKLSYRDFMCNINDTDKIVRIHEYSDKINDIALIDGNMPTNSNEIVVEEKLLLDNGLKLGNTINDGTGHEYTIVGSCKSALYFTHDRGISATARGNINYYAYAASSTFTVLDTSDIYLRVLNASGKKTSSKSYVTLIDSAIDSLNSIKESCQDDRFKELYGILDEEKSAEYGWSITDRMDNDAYANFINSSQSIENIGTVFPLVFYVVAVFISLISMLRMVEDDRGQVGTLKSLGFSNLSIVMKYIRYALIAIVIGSAIGIFVGSLMIPKIIWSIYNNIFLIPKLKLVYSVKYILIGVGTVIVCILAAVLFAASKALLEVPASLMRPKAPKPGKRVLLERIKPLWNHISFSNKICIRNIFRYKSRVFAMIIGIMGSTALILAGFGLRDSLQDVSKRQFDEIFKYDKIISVISPQVSANEIEIKMENDGFDAATISLDVTKAYNDIEVQEVSVLVADNVDSLNELIYLFDDNGNRIEISSDGVIITKKLSELFKLKIGDEVNTTIDGRNVSLPIAGIARQYVDHYIYISREYYEEQGFEFGANTVLVRTNEDNSFENSVKELGDGIIVSSALDARQRLEDVISSLDSVIIVLILSSSILAFAVMYNLANININERKRELSTLKVLGFYHIEVDNYINKEMLILTILGILFGLIGGYYLCHYILITCEVDILMFVRSIKPLSYLYTVIIIIGFSLVVILTTHRILKKINMLEALKSVE